MYLLGNGAVKRAKSAIVPCAKMNGKPAFVESPKQSAPNAPMPITPLTMQKLYRNI